VPENSENAHSGVSWKSLPHINMLVYSNTVLPASGYITISHCQTAEFVPGIGDVSPKLEHGKHPELDF